MWAIKGDAEAMFFLLFCLYYLPSDPRFFCFEVGRGCWSLLKVYLYFGEHPEICVCFPHNLKSH